MGSGGLDSEENLRVLASNLTISLLSLSFHLVGKKIVLKGSMKMKRTLTIGLLAGFLVNPLMMLLELAIALRRPGFEFGVPNAGFERDSMAMVYSWPARILSDVQISPPIPGSNLELAAIFLVNLVFYGMISAGMVRLLSTWDGTWRPFGAAVVGLLANPILLLLLLNFDWHMEATEMLTLTQLNREIPGVLFNWSIFLLPITLPFRYELIIALAANLAGFSALAYGFIRLVSTMMWDTRRV